MKMRIHLAIFKNLLFAKHWQTFVVCVEIVCMLFVRNDKFIRTVKRKLKNSRNQYEHHRQLIRLRLQKLRQELPSTA